MKKYFVGSLLVSVVVLVSGVANAASTIGTNMSTTGTFAQTVSSATAALFQNAAGTLTVLQVDTNTGTGRVGVGAAPSTTFEVQGTVSASYFFTGNTIQIGGGIVASVAYNRFGSTATTHSLSAVNDVLVNGQLEVDGNAFFDAKVGIGAGPSTVFEVQGTASASYFFTQNTLQVAGVPGATATVAYSRFGTGTTGNTGEFNAANDLLITGSLEVDGKASVAGNFQTSGRFIADTAASHSFVGDLILTSNLIARGTVTSQSSGLYTAEFGGNAGTATISLLFGSSTASSKGTCFQMKNTVGDWVYARILGTTWTVNYVKCHSTQ